MAGSSGRIIGVNAPVQRETGVKDGDWAVAGVICVGVVDRFALGQRDRVCRSGSGRRSAGRSSDVKSRACAVRLRRQRPLQGRTSC